MVTCMSLNVITLTQVTYPNTHIPLTIAQWKVEFHPPGVVLHVRGPAVIIPSHIKEKLNTIAKLESQLVSSRSQSRFPS